MMRRKAISPLIATVLLIGFTFTIAAILAGWGQNIVSRNVGEFSEKSEKISACGGGTLEFISGYPKVEGNRIKAVVEARGVPLGGFAFEVIANDNVTTLADITNASLAPGRVGTLISEELPFPESNISQLRIITNCSDVKTLFKKPLP